MEATEGREDGCGTDLVFWFPNGARATGKRDSFSSNANAMESSLWASFPLFIGAEGPLPSTPRAMRSNGRRHDFPIRWESREDASDRV